MSSQMVRERAEQERNVSADHGYAITDDAATQPTETNASDHGYAAASTQPPETDSGDHGYAAKSTPPPGSNSGT